MTLLQSIILGIIQGLTEFLPVSSSAHLVIAPYLLGWEFPEQEAFIFDVLVQLGTLLAVIIYFRQDLYRILVGVLRGVSRGQPFSDPAAKLGWMLVLGTIPAVVAGVIFKDIVEAAFATPLAVAFLLLGTASLLVIAELFGRRNRHIETTTWLDALVIGLFQALALLPGISRSGATITGGMLRNFERTSAARFSFLLSVPAMLGAGTVAVLDLFQLPDFSLQLPSLLAGFITSAVVGYLSIRWLLAYLVKSRLYLFAMYCLALAAVVIGVAYL